MLDKLKVIGVVFAVLSILRVILGEFAIPQEFDAAVVSLIDAIFVIIAVVTGWLTTESQTEVDKLVTK